MYNIPDILLPRIQQAHDENSRLSQIIEQKNIEIQQLKEREQSTQDELKKRAEKIKAHEEVISELQQKDQDYQRLEEVSTL